MNSPPMPAQLSDDLRETLEEGRSIPPHVYDEARRVARHARKAATGLFDDVDVLLAPSAPGRGALAESWNDRFLAFQQGLDADRQPLCERARACRCRRNAARLQLIGRFGRDKVALQAAHWLECEIAARFQP
jgi:Asp-tRNA(Asn)/Glu-tRNA(Gln) amidotransferase A subunit family amidase